MPSDCCYFVDKAAAAAAAPALYYFGSILHCPAVFTQILGQTLLVCFGGIFLIAFFFNWEFYAVAEAAITVASIAMGVYIAAVSALLGSQYAKDLKGKTDKEYPTKTLLGVLADYFRLAGIACVLLIIISCAFLIPTNMDLSSNYLLYLLRCGSAFSYAIFAANILLLWLILIFLVNSLGKSVK